MSNTPVAGWQCHALYFVTGSRSRPSGFGRFLKTDVVFLLVAAAFAGSLLVIVPKLAASAGVPASYIMRDAVSTQFYSVYIGSVSGLGVLLWAMACFIPLYTATFLERGERRAFLVALGLFSGLLMADDLYMIH